MSTTEQTQKRPHACTYEGCDRKFHSSSDRQHHVDFAHLGIYHFVCGHIDENGGETCVYKTAMADSLRKHKLVHERAVAKKAIRAEQEATRAEQKAEQKATRAEHRKADKVAGNAIRNKRKADEWWETEQARIRQRDDPNRLDHNEDDESGED